MKQVWELSGLELRKAACEGLGWTDITFMKGCSAMKSDYAGFPPTNAHIGRDWLPAIESDPAVSEPEFLKWCEENGYEWDICTCDPHDSFTTRHIVAWVHRPEFNFAVEVCGSTPSEARARSIVAASSQEGK